MIIRNEDIKSLIAEIPAEHKHMRMTISMNDGSSMTFLEATIANIVRAYITVKTHPTVTKVALRGQLVEEKKDGYAEWQLLENG